MDEGKKKISYGKIIKIVFIVIAAVVAVNIIVQIVKIIKTGGDFVNDTIKVVLGPFILLDNEIMKNCNKQKDCSNDKNYNSSKSKCEDDATCFWDDNESGVNRCSNATKRDVGDTNTGNCIGFIILGIVTLFGLLGLAAAYNKFKARTSDVDPALKDLAKKIDGLDIYEFKKELKKEMERDLEKKLEEFNEKQTIEESKITSKEGKQIYGELVLRKRLAEACSKTTTDANILSTSEKARFQDQIYNEHVTAYNELKEKAEKAEKDGKIKEEEKEAIDKAEKEFRPDRL